MNKMARRRSYGHARPREIIDVGVPNQVSVVAAIEKRGIVTVYTTLTSSGYDGVYTTLPLAESSTTTDTISTTTNNIIAKEKTSVLPTAISTVPGSDASGALNMAPSEAPTTSSTSSTSSTTLATSTSSTTSAVSATSTSTASSGSSSSDDAATKAGIALGVLGGLFVLLALAYWLIVRRRKQVEEEERHATADKEKFSGSDDDFQPPPPITATATRPPRLSLRMTGLFTELNTQGQASQQTTHQSNNSIGMANTGSTMRAPGMTAWERPMTSGSSSEHNPFGNNAQIMDEPSTPRDAMHAMTPVSEGSMHMTSPEHRGGLAPAPRVSALTNNTATTGRISAVTMDSATVPPIVTSTLSRSPPHSADVSPIESAYNVPVGQALTASDSDSQSEDDIGLAATIDRQLSERRQSVRKENVPAPLDLTLPPKLHAVPPSPAGTEFSMQEVEANHSPIASTSAAAIAAAGGPANSTVHRVQLDFKPTLDDEMGLQAGQLVRLLHEYDDGWALCIRLDRSEQGVVPRTCLSTRPVKPRTPPAGGPSRGAPINSQGRPRGPGANLAPGSRQMGPPGSQPYPSGAPGQRGPGYMRPMAPGGAGQRNQSPNGMGRKNSPPGPSNRQQEYQPNPNGAYYDSAASRPPPGQAY